ncbi:hypothetical protein LTR10_013603 [Elasticomyces elasticus]|uniref:Uncharacterized protein n=1 Tax=Exophiala sideris TaxID=1016849 RepID=A0ABR0JQ81_9EURO|nr:hypothetical protein LTR10_013603 [Elasticomyces elasticus]KAK5039742.1 hypothetical protein LTS07_000237 [Exophiala sideris]KAK5041294.1 hypothetical protein LTR13_002769 [Exophiala sideris]KAK5068120.1 hypothetical protein LTR69_000238 [Exophiala sideris]KAK5187421.1 hypothetical protein LTR44_000237 [Eurotiomycetes sp. CCFEE 6388]
MNRFAHPPSFRQNVIPPGYEWQDELREGDADDEEHSKDDMPTLTRNSLIFAMPKPSDWDELDEDEKMSRKRQFLCDRYGDLCFKFQDDPAHVGNPFARLLVFKNDYYALFEVWGAKHFESHYHNSMELLEHGLKMEWQDFRCLLRELQRNLPREFPPAPVRTPIESPAYISKVPETTGNSVEPVGKIIEKGEAPHVQASPPNASPTPETKQPEKKRTYKRKRAMMETDGTEHLEKAIMTNEKGEASLAQVSPSNASPTPETAQPEKKRRTYKRKRAGLETKGTEYLDKAVMTNQKALPPLAKQASPILSRRDDPSPSKQTPSVAKQPKQPRREKNLSKTPKKTTQDASTATPSVAPTPKKMGPTFTKNGKRLGRPLKRQETNSSSPQPQSQEKITDKIWATIPGTAFADRLQRLQTCQNVPAVPPDTDYQRRRLCVAYGPGIIDASNLERRHNVAFYNAFEFNMQRFCNMALEYSPHNLAQMAAKVASGLPFDIHPLPASGYNTINDWWELWNRFLSRSIEAFHSNLARSGTPLERNEVVAAEMLQLMRVKASVEFTRVLRLVRGMMRQGGVF